MAQKLKAVKQTHFEHANKPGSWLAYKLKKDKEKKSNSTTAGQGGEYPPSVR